MSDFDDYYELDSENTDPKRLKKERDKARKLKKSQWWVRQINQGICHYCQTKVSPAELTMDHVVPLARGGSSTPGNIVPSCSKCNQEKKLHTPADRIMNDLLKKS